MADKLVTPVAKVYVLVVVSLAEFCIETFNVDVSASTLGIINLWSTSVLSTVYLNVTSVPSKIDKLENL